MPEILYIDQNSEEWDQARIGVITSSAFRDVMAKTKTGLRGDTSHTYMRKIAGERITGKVADNYYGHHMERGHDEENPAIELYEARTGNKADLVGFVKNEDGFGASPDRLIGDDGIVEAKTALAHIQIKRLEKGILPSEYKKQVMGQLYVTGRKWVDFISYSPDIPLLIVRVERDEAYIEDMRNELFSFDSDVTKLVNKINGMW